MHDHEGSVDESVSYDTSDDEWKESNADEVWQELMNDVENELRERIESKTREGFSTKEARQFLLPLMQAKFLQKLIDRIILCQSLQQDPVYKLIKEAYREVKNEDGLTGETAWNKAVRKKRYLVDQKIELLMKQADDSSGEDTDDETEKSE